jgi:two-component system response regulator RpfG
MARVLIVDDQFISRNILEELVSAMDGRNIVHGFASATEALTWAAGNSPDLVLTDYKMPVMNGIEFTRRLRLLHPDVPIVMVTAMEDRTIRYQALEAGASDFLIKPVDHIECRARCRNLLALHHHQQLIKDRAQWLEQKVAEATREIQSREQETLLRLAKAGEYRDEGTGNHVLRMSKYSGLIARTLGLPQEECVTIEIAAPMHDIGKIGVPDAILLKPGKLDPDEWRIMQTHALVGYEILKDSPSKYLHTGAVIALGHHEKFDGSGYPGGLRGEDIPRAARIVAVADVFDALVTERPYKRAWSVDEALTYLKDQRGKHFDPHCLDAFLSRLDEVLNIHRALHDAPQQPQKRSGSGAS